MKNFSHLMLFSSAPSISSDVQAFLDYVEGITAPDDSYIAALDVAVQLAKKNANWRRECMIYEMEMKHARRKAAERGRAEGLAEGLAEGQQLQQIQLISAKIRKGKELSQIANELEDSEDSLRPLYELVLSAPDASVEEIFEKLKATE